MHATALASSVHVGLLAAARTCMPPPLTCSFCSRSVTE